MSKRSLAIALAILGTTVALTGHGSAQARPAGKVVVLESSAWAVAPGSTWAWAPVTTTNDPRLNNDILQGRMQSAVELALGKHGMVQIANRANARYVVSYHIAVQQKVDVKTSPNVVGGTVCGFRGCVRGYNAYPTVDVQQYNEGTLVIDIVDADSGKLVWRAASKKKVSGKDASQDKLNAVVADMMKTLPTA
jgi:hypothetical protein